MLFQTYLTTDNFCSQCLPIYLKDIFRNSGYTGMKHAGGECANRTRGDNVPLPALGQPRVACCDNTLRSEQLRRERKPKEEDRTRELQARMDTAHAGTLAEEGPSRAAPSEE